MLTLTSPTSRATFRTHGAELTSFSSYGLEYIWPADPAVWGRHAPVLFPIVGRLPDNTYLHHGQRYTLPQHGFARDCEFAVLSHKPNEITFRLTDDAASRAVYPFAFELLITYTLRENTLTTRWTVRNPAADAELLFSIGAHPAFRCPLLPGEAFEDYYFALDAPATAPRYLLDGGLLTGDTAPLLQQARELPLSYELFADDALVVKRADFEQITLRSRRSPHFVRAEFAGFPCLGLWTKGPGAGFVCIEPWHGIAGTVGEAGELRDKEGMLRLPPGGEFVAEYSLTFG